MLEQDFQTLTDLLAKQAGFEKETAWCRELQILIAAKRMQDAKTWILVKNLMLQLGPVYEKMRTAKKTLIRLDPHLYRMTGAGIDALLIQLEKCFTPIMELAAKEDFYRKNPMVRIPLGLAFYYGVGQKPKRQYTQDIFEMEARSGNIDACWLLGKFRKNLKIPVLDAVNYIKKAAETGVADAQYLLGDMYLGKWVDSAVKYHDVRLAADYYNRAAVQNHAKALYRLYELEREKAGNKSRHADKLFARALAAGSLDAMEDKGWIKQQQKDLKGATALFLPPACRGWRESQVFLAYIYNYLGNKTEALKWCAYAAGQNHSHAQGMLGRVYEAGNLGLEQNSRQAEVWYKEAVNSGKENEVLKQESDNIRARLLKIWWDRNEWSDPQQKQEINDFLKKIDLTQHPEIQELIGDLYATGEHFELGYPCDLQKARRCYESAADHDNESAMLKAAQYELEGKGGPREPQQALNYLETAVGLGNMQAALLLANIFFEGIEGIPADKKEAFSYYKQAANGESVEAYVRLGDCYFYGDGVTQSYEEAVKNYQKAVQFRQQSDLTEHAHAQMTKCYRDGLGVEVSPWDAFKHQLLAGNAYEPPADSVGKTQQQESPAENAARTQNTDKIEPDHEMMNTNETPEKAAADGTGKGNSSQDSFVPSISSEMGGQKHTRNEPQGALKVNIKSAATGNVGTKGIVMQSKSVQTAASPAAAPMKPLSVYVHEEKQSDDAAEADKEEGGSKMPAVIIGIIVIAVIGYYIASR